MREWIVILLLSSAVCASACGRTAGDNSDGPQSNGGAAVWSMTIEPVDSPAGPNSTEPQLTASDRGIILSWVERAGAMAHLKFAERTSSGWSEPTTVASGNNWFLSYADPPTVQCRPAAPWWRIGSCRRTRTTKATTSRSRIRKTTGRPGLCPFVPHHDGTEQQHAFASFFELPGNVLGVSWLDGRHTQPSDANPNGGPMALRYAAYDAQWKRTAEGVVDQQACECCSTMAATTSEGVLIAFPRPLGQGDSRHRRLSLREREVGRATTVHNDNFEVVRLPGERPCPECAWTPGGRSLVHGQERPGAGLRRLVE